MRKNIVMLVILAIVVQVLYLAFGVAALDAVGRVVCVFMGVGFIIFVHELGHFLTAKWVGAKVHRFYLGFAPVITIKGRKIPLNFFSFKKGDTEYGVGMLLFGGFVEIEGQDNVSAKGKKDELMSKKPWQRAVVFAAGAGMNAVFGFLLFILAFSVGVSFARPEIGVVVPGGPAWRAGIRPGDVITGLDGRAVSEFGEFRTNIALMRPGGGVDVTVERDGRTVEMKFQPIKSPQGLGMSIGVGQRQTATIEDVVPGSPAGKAGIRSGDTITRVRYTHPLTGREMDFNIENFEDFRSAVEPVYLIGRGVRVSYVRDGVEMPDLTLKPVAHEELAKMWRLGIEPEGYPYITAGMVVEEVAGGQSPDNPFKKGDTIVSIQGRKFDHFPDVRAAFPGAGVLALVIRRENEGGKPESLEKTLPAELVFRWINRGEQVVLADPGKVRVARIIPKSPAAGELNASGDALRPGDVIMSLGAVPLHSWDNYALVMKQSAGEEIGIKWKRTGAGGESRIFTGKIKTAQGMSDLAYIGVTAEGKRFIRRESPFAAVVVGWERTVLWGKRVFVTLRSLAVDRTVSSKHLAGPIGIAHISYKVLDFGFGQLIYILALISINLAIINLIPFPILDGGHLLFLAIEKVKGSPVSVKVQGYAFSAAGILLIALFMYVTFNDITRFFTGF